MNSWDYILYSIIMTYIISPSRNSPCSKLLTSGSGFLRPQEPWHYRGPEFAKADPYRIS